MAYDSRAGRPFHNLNEALADVKGGAVEKPRDALPVELAMKRADEESQTTGDLINRLFARLQPALTPEGPTNQTTGQTAPSSSPLADAIFGLSGRIASSNEALRRLLDRLEL